MIIRKNSTNDPDLSVDVESVKTISQVKELIEQFEPNEQFREKSRLSFDGLLMRVLSSASYSSVLKTRFPTFTSIRWILFDETLVLQPCLSRYDTVGQWTSTFLMLFLLFQGHWVITTSTHLIIRMTKCIDNVPLFERWFSPSGTCLIIRLLATVVQKRTIEHYEQVVDRLKSIAMMDPMVDQLWNMDLHLWNHAFLSPSFDWSNRTSSSLHRKTQLNAIHRIVRCFSRSHRYPVILDLENHCSVDQQREMARALKKILGGLPVHTFHHTRKCHFHSIWLDRLVAVPIADDYETKLPSPEALKYKVLLRVSCLYGFSSSSWLMNLI